MKMATATWPQLMLASVTMCNDDISNYNSKISDLGYLTPQSNGWCWDTAQGSVYIWFWALLQQHKIKAGQPYGRWNYYTLQLQSGTIMTFISPAYCTLQCGSGIMTVNSPSGSILRCDTWLRDDMPWNTPKRPPYWNSTSSFDFDHTTGVDKSFCTSHRMFIQIGPPSAEKNDVMSIFNFKTAHLGYRILDFRAPIMGSLNSPCTPSYSK